MLCSRMPVEKGPFLPDSNSPLEKIFLLSIPWFIQTLYGGKTHIKDRGSLVTISQGQRFRGILLKHFSLFYLYNDGPKINEWLRLKFSLLIKL